MSDENRPDESTSPTAPEQASSPDSAPPADPAPAAAASEPARQESPADKFRREVESKQGSLDDFEHEEELWAGGYSAKAMIGSWFLLVVVTVALIIAAIMMPQLTFPIALGIIAVLWVIVGLWYASRRLGFHYQLTTQRFIHQIGILTRRTDRIEVIDIDDVSYSQGPVERALGVGTIVITSSDRTHPELKMIGIEKVQEVAGLIDDVRRKERRKRSLHIEAI
ncbi:PH domain-containing protein [Crateriforma conspicua]|uniref:Bacterial membrane flanked domain protein n=1 Tax=Crateriforma conspicua TaxID=2527996 RepID=A0A5C6FXA5_9PLAN|nr:PH domain-containing protein [Crateriforma conspicua]TWU65673.1 Bacterial membrane flanked domain protein [Crateriforma conspicua]